MLAASLYAAAPCGMDHLQSDEPLLEPNAPLVLTLEQAARTCRVQLQPGEFVEISAVQPADLRLILLDPTGAEVVNADLRRPLQGAERLYAIARVAGEHRVRVEVLRGFSAGMHSMVAVESVRPATDRDRSLAEAATLYARASASERAKTGAGRRQAIDLFGQAVTLWRAAGARFEEGRTLHALGGQHADLGEPLDALRVYEQALAIRREMGDRIGEGITLGNMGTVHVELGDLDAAEKYYEQARTARLEAGDPEGEASSLQSLGYVLLDRGDLNGSITHMEQAAAMWERLERPEMQGLAEHNIGWAHVMFSDYDRALAHFERARTLRRAAGDIAGEAQTLNQIANVYRILGAYDRAIEYHETSLAGRRRAGDRRGEAYTLLSLGHVRLDRQEYDRASEDYASAVDIFRTVSDRSGLSSAMAHLAAAAGRAGQVQRAQQAAGEALGLVSQFSDRTVQPALLNRIGDAQFALGNYDAAAAHYEHARALASELRVPTTEATALLGLGRAAQARGELEDARRALASAIDIVESLRVSVTRADLRASFLASKSNVFESYVAVLMELHRENPAAGFAAQALEVSERRRARSLLEMLFEARADIRADADAQLLDRERQLQGTINAKADRLARRGGSPRAAGEIATAQRELDALVEELREVWAQLRVRSPKYAALARPVPADVGAIQQRVLDDKTLLLEYALGDERSYVWAVTSTSLTVHELPAKATIDKAARQAYDLLAHSTRRELRGAVRHALSELSAMVVGPVANELGDKRLVVVPDGALQYVPFAALPRPRATRSEDEPLIIRHEVVTLPSASVLDVLRNHDPGTRAARPVAVLADPVLDAHDSRVKGSPGDSFNNHDLNRAAEEAGVDRLDRLPFTRREARAIVARVGPGAMQALDFDASRETATSAQLAQFQVVHFATHALLNTAHPELSGIVLSLVDPRGRPHDGFLRLHDIFNLRLGARLVVLSACQTALGADVRGEGLVGLTRGFMHAGAAAVMASLWNIRDEATAELMGRFYDGMFRKNLSPAAALREAQLWMRAQPRWGQPAYWAGFVLQGDWRSATP